MKDEGLHLLLEVRVTALAVPGRSCSGRVDGRLKLVFGKKACCRSVGFAEASDNAVAAKPKLVSENLRGLARLALAACENAAHPFRPSAGCHRVHARSTAPVERPIGNRDVRIDRDIGMGDEENRRH
jgi:hypothetical protein